MEVPSRSVQEDQDRVQEAQHGHHLPVLLLHVGGNQLLRHAFDGYRSVLAVVRQEEVSEGVHQVQRESKISGKPSQTSVPDR